jgi:hypothetical protein
VVKSNIDKKWVQSSNFVCVEMTRGLQCSSSGSTNHLGWKRGSMIHYQRETESGTN